MSWPCATIGETSDHAPFTECTWASGLNVAAAGTLTVPPTPGEREALRVDGGGSDDAGANFAMLSVGWKKRYGKSSTARSGSWTPIADALAKGNRLTVAGVYNSLPAHFQRFQPGGTFFHAVAVGPDPGGAWWIDPLGPDGYGGEVIPISALQTFCSTDAYKNLVWEGAVSVPISVAGLDGPRVSVALPANTHADLYDLAVGKVGTLGAWGSTHTFRGVTGISITRAANDPSVPRGTGWTFLLDNGLYVPTAQIVPGEAPPSGGDVTHEIALTVDGVPRDAVTV